MINLGKLKEIKDLRKVWPHEALDFTPWIAEEDNLALLADAVGLEITIDLKWKKCSRNTYNHHKNKYRNKLENNAFPRTGGILLVLGFLLKTITTCL